jgi:hypothetical protein
VFHRKAGGSTVVAGVTSRYKTNSCRPVRAHVAYIDTIDLRTDSQMTIQPLPPLPRLKLDKSGKPTIPSWVAPPETKLDLEWQSLRVLDLSLLDGTPEQQQECQDICQWALTNEGFLLLVGHGVAEEDVSDSGSVYTDIGRITDAC